MMYLNADGDCMPCRAFCTARVMEDRADVLRQ